MAVACAGLALRPLRDFWLLPSRMGGRVRCSVCWGPAHLPSACLQCPVLPRSAGIELKPAQFLCFAADSPRFQNSCCEKAVFSLLLCVGNSEQQERKSVCMSVSGCISLILHFEDYFLSHKHWRLFILYLKLPRSWWYLLNRIYFWFLFILQ